jgi:hypothetical protein
MILEFQRQNGILIIFIPLPISDFSWGGAMSLNPVILFVIIVLWLISMICWIDVIVEWLKGIVAMDKSIARGMSEYGSTEMV